MTLHLMMRDGMDREITHVAYFAVYTHGNGNFLRVEYKDSCKPVEYIQWSIK